MVTTTDYAPFTDLPQALVEEMFGKSRELSSGVADHISQIHKKKDELRSALKEKLRHESEIIRTPKFPTAVGVDGSYYSDKLLATDFVAMAAVAVEGLIPRISDEPIWPQPHHFVNVESLAHDEASQVLAKAIMFSMEVQLAALAPHSVVLLDGSFTTLTIAYNQAFGHSTPEKLVNYLEKGNQTNAPKGREKFGSVKKTLENYRDILESKRIDKIAAAIPKYSRRNEICDSMGIKDFDDRGVLSLILSPGEFTKPVSIEKEGGGKWLTAKLPQETKSVVEQIEKLLNNAYVLYYKPYKDFPAIRLEFGQAIAKNDARLAILLEAVKIQSGTPGMMEPYPTFLADKMVKHLSTALPAMKGVAITEIASKWEGEIGDIILATHSYRT